MTDEQRLQMITEQLILVRDNLFRGLSKSMQKLQARSINEVLELPNHTQSPQRTWVGLTDVLDFIEEFTGAEWERHPMFSDGYDLALSHVKELVEAKLKEKNT